MSGLFHWFLGPSFQGMQNMRNVMGDKWCPICSYARFGRREFGITTPPEPHKCPEQDERDYRGGT